MTNTLRVKRVKRQLIVIDIENLVGTGSPTSEGLDEVLCALRAIVPDFDRAQRVVACSHHAALTVERALPTARHLWRTGPNGADMRLLEVLDRERVEERFTRVTICSGDGIFAASAARLAAADVDVTVVSLPGHLAARLELAARTVKLLVPHVATDLEYGGVS